MAVVLFFTAAVEEPQESRLEPSESHIYATVLTFCSQRKNLIICIKERAPIFLSNTHKGKGREKGLEVEKEDLLEEHMLCITLLFEYKSSWRERPVSWVLQKDWSHYEYKQGQSLCYIKKMTIGLLC